MHRPRPRRARPRVAPFAVCAAAAAALAACSGSSSAPVAQSTTPSPPTSAAASPVATNRAAEAVVRLAARATTAQRAYSFVADERIAAGTSVRTHLVGRVVRGRGLAYTLAVGTRRTQVVRLPHATFLRTVPGGWSRLTKPRKLLNPTATLLGVLHGMAATGVVNHGTTRVVSGQLPPSAAHVAGLPQLSAPAHVVVAVARAGDVVGVVLRAETTVNGHALTIVVRTRYASFGHVAPIRRPA